MSEGPGDEDELAGIEIVSKSEDDADKKIPKRRGRPPKTRLTAIEGGKKDEPKPKADEALPEGDTEAFDYDPGTGFASEINRGVTVNFLSLVFNKHRDTITKRLGKLEPHGTRRGSSLYEFRAAVEAIVEPALRETIAREERSKMRSQNAGVEMGKEYWEEQILKMKFAMESGQLWPREEVIASIAEILKPLKVFLMSLEDEVDNAKRDGIPLSDLGRAQLVKMHATMKKIATDDPLRAYRSEYAETEDDDEDGSDVADGDT